MTVEMVEGRLRELHARIRNERPPGQFVVGDLVQVRFAVVDVALIGQTLRVTQAGSAVFLEGSRGYWANDIHGGALKLIKMSGGMEP